MAIVSMTLAESETTGGAAKRPPFPRLSPTMDLTPYEAARRALHEARNVDDVKNVVNQAAAIHEYARRAKDYELIALATEIRLRAERRLGEMMAQQPKAMGGGDQKSDHRVSKKPSDVATLADAGIDKNLAHRARKAASLSTKEFEKKVTQAMQDADKRRANKPHKRSAPRKFSEETRERVASLVIDAGKSHEAAGTQEGVSNIVVRTSVAYEEGRRQGRREAEIDPSLLPKSAQEKLESAIRQEKKKLRAQFDDAVSQEIKSYIEATILPHYEEKEARFDDIIKSRKGMMTKATYRLISSCLHPDRVSDAELKKRFTDAFHAFRRLKIIFLDEKEMPTGPSTLPRSYEEMVKRRADVMARRRKQANNVPQKA